MGYAWTPWIFTLLAIVELVTDQLPSTPSRKVPMQFGARIVSGALSGATIGVAAGSWIVGLIAGVIGAVIGTYGGAEIRASHGEGVWARSTRRLHRGRRRHHPRAHRRLGAPVNRRFDAIVIGAGQAGPPMVGRLAAAGQKVALIERDLIGGTCVNTGCTPTKALVASAYAAHLARRAMDFGVKVGPVGVDFAAVMARKNAVVGNSRSHLTDWLEGMANCTVIRGHARFLVAHDGPGRRRRARGRAFLHQRRRPSDRFPTFPAAIRSGRSPTRHCLNSTPCPGASSSLAEATSGSSSRRCFDGWARKSRWWKRRRGSFRARTKRSRTRSAKSSRRRASRSGSQSECIHFATARRRDRGRRQLHCPASLRSSARMCCSRSGAAPTPTTSGSRPRA